MADQENRPDDPKELENLNEGVLDAENLSADELDEVAGGGCTDFTGTCERFSGSCTGFSDTPVVEEPNS